MRRFTGNGLTGWLTGRLTGRLSGGLAGGLLGAMLLAGSGQAGTTEAMETYDLLFRSGTLNSVSRDRPLRYSRAVQSRAAPEAAARDSGEIELSFIDTDDRPETAILMFYQDEKHRGLGSFPASVGNPIVMYFVETVVRDMVENVGGSRFMCATG